MTTARKIKPWNGEFRLVPVEDIEIDYNYQREPKKLVDLIASEYDWAKYGALSGSSRENGKVYVYEGQQRFLAALRVGATHVPVVLFPMESKGEANAFVDINVNRLHVSPFEKFMGRLHEQEPVVMLINKTVEEYGLTISSQTMGGDDDIKNVTAISTLERIYNHQGEQGLRDTLAVVTTVWPNDRRARGSHVLQGIATFLQENEGVDTGEFAAALSETTPGDLIRKADSLRFDMGGSKRKNMQRAIDLTVRNFKRRERVRKAEAS